jgi:hypothetical protein
MTSQTAQKLVSEALETPEPNSFHVIVSEAKIDVSNAIQRRYAPTSETVTNLFLEVLGPGYSVRAHKGREGSFQIEVHHKDGDCSKFTIS